MRPRSILSALGTAMFVTVASNQALDARQPQKPAVQQTPSPTSPGAVEDVALQIAAANPGVLLTVGWAKSIDAKAVEISFEEVDAKLNKADMARVLLQVTSAVSRFHPNLVVFSRKGNQYLLLAKADLPDVVNEFEHGNKLAAVRMFAERVKRPTGESLPLPSGLIPRTAAAFDVGNELRGSVKSGTASETAEGTSPSNLGFDPAKDKWKPTVDGGHGPLIQQMITRVRPSSLELKDGRRIAAKDLDAVLRGLFKEISGAYTNVHVITKQAEQGGTRELPEGASELANIRVQFDELLPALDESTLVPISDVLLVAAPESTFVGQSAFGKNGEPKGRIVGKRKIWHSGISKYSSGQSHYTSYLITDDGALGSGWNDDGANLKWGDVKKKLALEFSPRRIAEDNELERQALRQ